MALTPSDDPNGLAAAVSVAASAVVIAVQAVTDWPAEVGAAVLAVVNVVVIILARRYTWAPTSVDQAVNEARNGSRMVQPIVVSTDDLPSEGEAMP